MVNDGDHAFLNRFVEYAWGNFKHSAEEVLARYFDAFLYMANWGSRRIMFRFPAHLFDTTAFKPYYQEWGITWKTIGDVAVLDLYLRETEIYEWIEGGDRLARLASLRNDILAGDLRVLYLTWLALLKHGSIEGEEMEPPVPPGLATLSPALQALAEFFDLDTHLVAAAAEVSPPAPAPITPADLSPALVQLSRAECEDFLRRLLNGDGQVALDLRQRLLGLIGKPPPSLASPQRRAAGLRLRANELAEEEKRRQQQEAQRQCRDFLIAQAARQQEIWQEVDACIQKKQARSYAEAVEKLQDLRDIAAMQSSSNEFQQKLNALHDEYQRRYSFIELLNKAGLKRKL